MTRKIHFHRKTKEELDAWAAPARPLQNGAFHNTLRFACRREFWPHEYKEGRYRISNILDEVTCQMCLKQVRREIREEQYKRDLQESMGQVLVESGVNLSDILPE